MTKITFHKHILLFASIFILNACLGNTAKRDSLYGTDNNKTAEYYLQQSDKRQGLEQAEWKLKAAAAYAKSKRFAQAYGTLRSFEPTQLPIPQRDSYYLLRGESALNVQDSFEALRALQNISQPENKSLEWNRHHQLLLASALGANKRYVDAAMIRVASQQWFDNPVQLDNNFQRAWSDLEKAQLGELQLKRVDNQSLTEQGWLDLAILKKQYANNPRLLSESLKDWSDIYFNHPAIDYLPQQLIQLRDAPVIAPRKIALLLPLTGRLAAVGNTIRDGFFSSYFATPRTSETPEVIVLDSANGDSIDSLYQSAMNQGAEFVVGPLLKKHIDRLALQQAMPLPTLVLNRLQNNLNPANFYQFGLPVEDEAAQIAELAIARGESRAFVINADNSSGQRAVNSFVRTFEELGGVIVKTATISNNQDPKVEITRLLGVDQMERRSKELQNMLNIPITNSGQGSAEADFIFMIAKPKAARIIKPYLNYYYAYNMPVYATSAIYNGRSNIQTDNDLSGITFTDSPWMLGSDDSIRQAKQSLFKLVPQSSGSLARFFALGHDAHSLIPEIPQLEALTDYSIKGLSGDLSLDNYGRVVRQLAWGKYIKGKVEPINQ